MRLHHLAAVTALCLAALPMAGAQADVFNGRIAFSSFRTDPAGRVGDIFSINPDGTDLLRLTDNPLDTRRATGRRTAGTSSIASASLRPPT
jgi:hypothetical protein